MMNPPQITNLDPQLIFQAYLQATTNLAKQLERIKSGKMNSTLWHLKKSQENMERRINLNNPKQMEATLTQIKVISNRIKEVEQMRYAKMKSTAKANRRLLAETVKIGTQPVS